MATAATALSHSIPILPRPRRHDRRLFFLREVAGCVCRVPARFPLRATTKTLHAPTASVSVQEEAPASSLDTSSPKDTSSLKLDLLGMVAGLDRGLLASESEQVKISTVAGLLEDACGPVKLGDGEAMQGRWRLIYSSAFVSGSLGGRRPGPPVGVLPLTLGQVYQRIDVLARELDNIVELQLRSPWPLPPVDVTATLAHTYQIVGNNNVKIIFEKTSAKFGGGLSQLPPVTLPQLPDYLRPSPTLRSGSFECTYLDESMRITRGDREELRVFVKS